MVFSVRFSRGFVALDIHRVRLRNKTAYTKLFVTKAGLDKQRREGLSARQLSSMLFTGLIVAAFYLTNRVKNPLKTN